MEIQYTEKTSSCLKTEILEQYFKHCKINKKNTRT